jgi:hypothetical protein
MEHMDKDYLVVTEDLLMTLTELEYVKIEWGFKALLTKLLFSDFFPETTMAIINYPTHRRNSCF